MNCLLSLLSLMLVFAISGCAPEEPVDANRGPLGKADSFGSCQSSDCNSQSIDGSCYCDFECAFFGDCCADKVEVCDAPVSPTCGGKMGLSCDNDQYCHFEESETCGLVDRLGSCLPIPEICTKEFAPVCGCDGNTYSNTCHAAAGGTSVASEGVCEDIEQPTTCGGLAGSTCDNAHYCQYEVSQSCGSADQQGVCQPVPGICTQEFAPVCGCDGNTYSNPCHAAGAGKSVAHNGSC